MSYITGELDKSHFILIVWDPVVDMLMMVCKFVTINHIHPNDGGMQLEEGILCLPMLFKG
jgi:hypothetical protein